MAEPLNATFFALKRRDRAVLLPASIIYALIVLALVAVWIGLNWSALNWMFSLMRDYPSEPTQATGPEAARMLASMFSLFGWTFFLLIPFYMATAAYEAACLRWMIRGEAPGLFGLTLNNDTWRVWGVYWAWVAAQYAISFVMMILMFPLMFMMMGDIAAQGGTPDSDAMMEWQLKFQAITALQYIPLVFIGIRFGPAAATSVARKRFSFFEAWSVTRDRFFALLGSYALLWLIFGLAFAALYAAVAWTLYGSLFRDLLTTWPDVPARSLDGMMGLLKEPRTWIITGGSYLGFGGLILLYGVLSYGINARAVLAAIDEGRIETGQTDG